MTAEPTEVVNINDILISILLETEQRAQEVYNRFQSDFISRQDTSWIRHSLKEWNMTGSVWEGYWMKYAWDALPWCFDEWDQAQLMTLDVIEKLDSNVPLQMCQKKLAYYYGPGAFWKRTFVTLLECTLCERAHHMTYENIGLTLDRMRRALLVMDRRMLIVMFVAHANHEYDSLGPTQLMRWISTLLLACGVWSDSDVFPQEIIEVLQRQIAGGLKALTDFMQ